jgi:hypothetical protein
LAESKPLVEPADKFGRHVAKLKATPGGDEVFAALVEALPKLRDYDFQKTFPEFYSAYGDSYAFRFHPDYLLTFTRELRSNRVLLRLRTIQKA